MTNEIRKALRALRIIAGSAKGRKIITPEGRNTRPTSDRVKESIFGILQFRLPSKSVLDLFAGSGSLGLESISRGACYCVFVDKDHGSIQAVSENVRNLGFGGQCEIIQSDFSQAIKRLSSKGSQFDFIFMDPPYAAGVLEKAIELIFENDLLSDGGTIIAEHTAGKKEWENIKSCDIYDTRTYGNTAVSFIRKAEI